MGEAKPAAPAYTPEQMASALGELKRDAEQELELMASGQFTAAMVWRREMLTRRAAALAAAIALLRRGAR